MSELESQQRAVGEHLRTTEQMRVLEQRIASLGGRLKKAEARLADLERQADERPLRQRIAELVG